MFEFMIVTWLFFLRLLVVVCWHLLRFWDFLVILLLYCFCFAFDFVALILCILLLVCCSVFGFLIWGFAGLI